LLLCVFFSFYISGVMVALPLNAWLISLNIVYIYVGVYTYIGRYTHVHKYINKNIIFLNTSIHFSSLISLSRTSSTMLIRSGKRGYFLLSLHLRGKKFQGSLVLITGGQHCMDVPLFFHLSCTVCGKVYSYSSSSSFIIPQCW
jgi:hypothetical protein